MDWLIDLVGRYRRAIPGEAAAWGLGTVVVLVVNWLSHGPMHPVVLVAAMAFGFVALGPLLWLRWEHPRIAGPHVALRTLVAAGAGLLWAVICLLGFGVIVALLEASGLMS